ncbi:response regulator [Flavobacterium sp. ARAG 55.4]|uniref:response regulator n=1 Tax=Flavobacterium sp. ARAG 55.4 TaxID=3451357 RepID=UPI003F4756F1
MEFRNLLLIDDDTDDQEIFISAIEIVSAEMICTAMTDASAALEKLLTSELQPDVIFVDLNMPIMNGQEFVSRLKKVEQFQSVPVIIFSTSASPETIANTKELGAADFITKPNSFNDLVKILSSLFTN